MKNIKRIAFTILLMFFSTYRVFADTFYYSDIALPDNAFGSVGETCSKVLGTSVITIVHGSVNMVRIFAVIIAIANAIITLVPAVIAKDAEALKKATHKCVVMGVVLAAIGIFPSIVRLITSIFGFDTTCIF